MRNTRPKDLRQIKRAVEFRHFLAKESKLKKTKNITSYGVKLLIILQEDKLPTTCGQLKFATQTKAKYIIKNLEGPAASGLITVIPHEIASRIIYEITDKGILFLNDLEARIRRARPRPRIKIALTPHKLKKIKRE